MVYLIIETSTDKGLIACLHNQEVIFSKDLLFGQNHSLFLMPELNDSLNAYNINDAELTCIGVGIGPGSYTGIRIGVSVAQALAFCWNLPLIGIPSLNGFVPKTHKEHFAAIIDARIGGAYIRTGVRNDAGIQFLSEPEVCPLEELHSKLMPNTHLVTPNSLSLNTKLQKLYPDHDWTWEERYPCLSSLADYMHNAIEQGGVCKAGELTLMYLRQTQAEREKELKALTA